MAGPAILALEDGTVFEGEAIGASGKRSGEVVFNTSMTGYQEVLTDPSYHGQIVTMTYPLIGNYGVCDEHAESRRIWLEGFVVRELSPVVSNPRAQEDLDSYLHRHDIPGIQGIDTRELTKRLRTTGALKGVLGTRDPDGAALVAEAKAAAGLEGRDLVREVTCGEPFGWNGQKTSPDAARVVVIDCGVKFNILRMLAGLGLDVAVVPSSATAEEILALRPDGLVLSNGPGDPEPVAEVIATVRTLLEKLPIFGICLGQQILALALGGKTYKLKFGHHGGNHPVKDLRGGKVAITVQNHGFCVDIDSLPADDVEITHINLNDQTLEGMRHKHLPVFSVQYHPEASPGPHDAQYLFEEFAQSVKARKR